MKNSLGENFNLYSIWTEKKKEEIEGSIMNAFGSEHFLNFSQFVTVFSKVAKIDENTVKSFEYLFSNRDGKVPRDTWDSFSRWFSPITFKAEEGFSISLITQILQEKCFFGFVSGSEARTILEKKPPGTYILRFSSSPKSYAISVSLENGTVGHWKIESQFKQGEGVTFILDNISFKSLQELIKHFKQESLSSPVSPITLKTPHLRP